MPIVHESAVDERHNRSKEPHAGFFVLNRNGLEYVQEFIKADSEVRMEGDFILFEPSVESTVATGIWVYDEKERASFFAQMDRMKASAASSPQPAHATKQSISLDDLFGTLPSSAPTTQATTAKPVTAGSLLDTLFASATSESQPEPEQPPAVQAQAQQPKAKPKDAGDLLAMIGLGSAPSTSQQAPARTAPVPQSAPATSSSSGGPKPNFAPPLLSHDIFDALPLPAKISAPNAPPAAVPVPPPKAASEARVGPKAEPRAEPKAKAKSKPASPAPPAQPAHAPAPAKAPEPKANGKQNGHDATKARGNGLSTEMALPVVDAALEKARVGLDGSVSSGEPIGRDEFVRSVEDLLKVIFFLPLSNVADNH